MSITKGEIATSASALNLFDSSTEKDLLSVVICSWLNLSSDNRADYPAETIMISANSTQGRPIVSESL